MNVKEAIEQRRSIRRYKSDEVSDEMIRELIEAARWAPSGTNSQPWRFVIVKDADMRAKIREVGFNQKFLTGAPVILVCCVDLMVYVNDVPKRVAELADAGALNPKHINDYPGLQTRDAGETLKLYRSHAMLNLALSMENIALRAVSLGLGTCIVQHMKPKKVAELLGLPETTIVVALMTVGFANENPGARPRIPLEDMVIGEI